MTRRDGRGRVAGVHLCRCALYGLGNIEPQRKPGLGGEFNERISVKFRDPPAKQVVKLGLRDPEAPRGLGRRQSPAPHSALNSHHQTGTYGHNRGLGRRVLYRVPYIRKALTFH